MENDPKNELTPFQKKMFALIAFAIVTMFALAVVRILTALGLL